MKPKPVCKSVKKPADYKLGRSILSRRYGTSVRFDFPVSDYLPWFTAPF